MNAGRDVEPLISGWLSEEAPEHAPDRILTSAGRIIDRTRQRRPGAAWKEPTMTSTARLLGAAAVLIVAVAGAAWIGRSTAGVGGPSSTQSSASPAPTPTPSAPAVTLESYRAARDAYCKPANTRLIALNAQGDKLDPAGSAADRVAMISILQQIIALGDEEIAHLSALDAPPEMAADHAIDIVHHQDSVALLREMLTLLEAGKVTEANAVSDATQAMSSADEAFEAKYSLAGCP
jgi:hypothetical protein